jgi:hypothetical protein
MKSAREAMIRGGAASVERALMDARPAIEVALRDPRWMPPPPPLALLAADGDSGGRGDAKKAAAAAAGTYAPPADEAEAYKVWEAPVRRLRLSREACTALGIGAGRNGGAREDDHGGDGNSSGGGGGGGVPLALAALVYEASADAAAAMRCADGELLKALAGLCGAIYPALRRRAQQQQLLEEEEGRRSPPPASSPPPPPPRLPLLPLLSREAEMRAALVLFYACMPARPLPQNLAQCLSNQPAPFWQDEEELGEEGGGGGGGATAAATAAAAAAARPTARERALVRAALRGAAAALSGDWVAFGACYARMPRLPRHVMARCLPRLRRASLRCMARAFAPSLPVSRCEGWLGLRAAATTAAAASAGDRHAPLVALLEEGAKEGCRGCAAALEAREAARRARLDAAWEGGGGGDGRGGGGGRKGGEPGGSWEEEDSSAAAGEKKQEQDDFFVELVFKPPPPPPKRT